MKPIKTEGDYGELRRVSAAIWNNFDSPTAIKTWEMLITMWEEVDTGQLGILIRAEVEEFWK